ncbi:type 1 fimbrial protein [Salmonella enterica subsp. salamae]|nr:type 1 fimbrial protein [Salmonella enterica subsp. salamae]ECJ2282164.1 type 1 fimbrial protein [Salmonella enterica subsp. salamae]HCC0889470.1 type 1 fimbrial protein [Salmonella enterica]
MNNLKKSAIAGVLALCAGQACATDGTINFTGEILQSTCDFADQSRMVNVELGHYGRKQFTEPGAKSPTVYFTIPLMNCPTTQWTHLDGTEGASFRLWLETRDHDSTIDGQNLLAVTSMKGSAAEGVGIRVALQDGTDEGTPIKLDQLDDNVIPITGESMDLDLQAYYVSTVATDDIKPGPANASVDVTFDYR